MIRTLNYKNKKIELKLIFPSNTDISSVPPKQKDKYLRTSHSSQSSFPGEAEARPAVTGRQISLQMRTCLQMSYFQGHVPGMAVELLCVRGLYMEMNREWHSQTVQSHMETGMKVGKPKYLQETAFCLPAHLQETRKWCITFQEKWICVKKLQMIDGLGLQIVIRIRIIKKCTD